MFAAISHSLNQRIQADKLLKLIWLGVIGYEVPHDTHEFLHARPFDYAQGDKKYVISDLTQNLCTQQNDLR